MNRQKRHGPNYSRGIETRAASVRPSASRLVSQLSLLFIVCVEKEKNQFHIVLFGLVRNGHRTIRRMGCSASERNWRNDRGTMRTEANIFYASSDELYNRNKTRTRHYLRITRTASTVPKN
ncbi:hypothetical protein PoB_000809600 [Plakobranchus ocellatus]|uniref:Uncharacterized protein n=1 Tax=Plakobranchus ocellatus TaxID=259542 RepID=A0AAV3Y2Z4_9GAST|nr:hypothetical protein PoB_000809600 [Plakobranchus ocellatus]